MFARPLFAVLLALTALPSFADTTVYRQLVDASVWIVNFQDDSTGSGIVIDTERRLVLTNYHVVGESPEVLMFFAAFDSEGSMVCEKTTYVKNAAQLKQAGLACKGTVVGTWKSRDLALVQLDSIPEDVTAVPLAAQGATPGDAVHSVGNPGASQALWVYSPGKVRQVYRSTTDFGDGMVVDARRLEVTSPINGGDSGSGMVNSAGELIGIVASHRVNARLLSYAIDITEVKAFLTSYGMEAPVGTVVAGNMTASVSWPQ